MARILMADDDATMIDFVRLVLEMQGHHLVMAHNGQEALEIFNKEKPDLVLLDIMMPQMNGMEVCQKIRQQAPLIPILFLSARQQLQDRINGLQQGADDYIVKPFNRKELLARVETALRRNQAIRQQTGHLSRERQIDSLWVNADTHQAIFEQTPLSLSPTEFQLLWTFCDHVNRVLERDFLLQQVWGYDASGQSRTVDIYAGRIRKKLEAVRQQYNQDYPFLETLYGVGYRLVSSGFQTHEN